MATISCCQKAGLSCWPKLICTFGDAAPLIGSEGGMNSVEQGRDGGVAALGQFVMLDDAEGGFDVVEVGAIRRQEREVDAACPEVGDGRTGFLAAVDGAIVEHDDRRDGHRRQFPEERDQMVGAEAARLRHPVQRGRSTPDEGGERIDATALRILVGHTLALPPPHPGVGHRLAGGEAALVEVDQADAPGSGFF